MQSVGEYEARYGAYDTRRQEQRPQEPEEDNRDSPRIFRNEQKKPTRTNTRQLPSAEKVKIRKCQKFTPKSRCLSEISADCKCRLYILQFFVSKGVHAVKKMLTGKSWLCRRDSVGFRRFELFLAHCASSYQVSIL